MSEPSMPPVIADDPFWRTVRERHPDVDLVLLPPAVAAPHDSVPGTFARARWLAGASEKTLDNLQKGIGTQFAARTGRWTQGARTGQRQYVATAALTSLERSDVVIRLRAIGDHLLDLGWDARPSVDGTLAIRAVGDEMVMQVEASQSMISVEVRTTSLPLTDAEASHLEDAHT